jgi:hypothetical protein
MMYGKGKGWFDGFGDGSGLGNGNGYGLGNGNGYGVGIDGCVNGCGNGDGYEFGVGIEGDGRGNDYMEDAEEEQLSAIRLLADAIKDINFYICQLQLMRGGG